MRGELPKTDAVIEADKGVSWNVDGTENRKPKLDPLAPAAAEAGAAGQEGVSRVMMMEGMEFR